MKLETIKDYIESNKDKFPLSFSELVFRNIENTGISDKVTYSEKYKDGDYAVNKFYKPITRF